MLLPVNYEEKSCLGQTHIRCDFVHFSSQCKSELEVWYRGKNKLNWNRPMSCSASESLLWALVLDLILLEDSLEDETFWHIEETTNSILVDPELILSWHWVDTGLLCTGAQQVVGGAMGTDTLCILVIIVSGYLVQINYKSSEVYLSCNRKTHMSISVPLY